MFFSASIALASMLSLSKITVNSAPVVGRDVVPQACTQPLFRGLCTPLNGTSCTNTLGVLSLVLNRDANCAAFPLPDCEIGVGALEQFSDDSLDLTGKIIQSVQCFENPGTVNGFTAGSEADIEQEQADEEAANGFVPTPPANCTPGPITASPEEQAEADANGVVLSGPVTRTFDD
ncbi:hypothetical protein B0H19DRAFT_1192898 [Mycena capillaripes]|nr:hypothetical protein B0H19DRAFT_1192898 [Mycena capillaripes]